MKGYSKSIDDVVFTSVNYFLMCIMFLIVFYPLYFIIISSFSDPVSVNSGRVWIWVKGFNLDGYRRIIQTSEIWNGYKNTIIYTVLGTILNVSLTILAAYPLSRREFTGRKIIMKFIVITMLFNGGIIPTYILVSKLGLANRAIMIIMGAVAVYNLIIARTFINTTLPDELYDAATVDGCSLFTYFFQIVLPLSKTIIAVMVLFYGIGHWNEFFRALIYLKEERFYPLQLVLRKILIMSQIEDSAFYDVLAQDERAMVAEIIKYGSIIISSAPLLMIYPFMQKYFIKGIMIGSVKG